MYAFQIGVPFGLASTFVAFIGGIGTVTSISLVVIGATVATIVILTSRDE